jgi:glyoxylase I family protein
MQTSGLNHIILTVSNTERSRAFYGDLLGFDITVLDGDPDRSFFFSCGGVQFFLFPSRRPQPGDQFSEFRIGLDHLSFTAPDRKALDDLAQKLLEAGIPTKGVEQFVHTGNWYVSFRDPDNIQLEFWLPHPG